MHEDRSDTNSEAILMNDTDPDPAEMPKDLDFSDAANPQIGKFSSRMQDGVRMVVLDPDIASRFPDAAAVNAALRSLPTQSPASDG